MHATRRITRSQGHEICSKVRFDVHAVKDMGLVLEKVEGSLIIVVHLLVHRQEYMDWIFVQS